MSTLTFVQGDDWEIDIFYERFVGGAWVAEPLTGASFAMSLRRDAYEQAMSFSVINAAEGHGRFVLAAALSASAPIADLATNIRVLDDGKRSSTLPITVKVVEDYTP